MFATLETNFQRVYSPLPVALLKPLYVSTQSQIFEASARHCMRSAFATYKKCKNIFIKL